MVKAMSKYPDISHYHTVKDWAKVKKNCPFLISKATQGTSFVDSSLDSFIKGCEKHKIPYWLYTFFNKGNELAQAKFMVSTCRKKVGKYFMGYILDVEQNNLPHNVDEALKYIKTQSKKCMIYTMYSQYGTYASVIKNRGSSVAWWEARYGANNGAYNKEHPCHSGADLHQFTSCGSCDGIGSGIDLNRVTGHKKESWFTTNSTTKKTANKTATKKSVTTIAEEVIAGKWGNGLRRRIRLTKAGYNYRIVQKKVNSLMKKK